MAFNPDPKIADCRELSNKWRSRMIIVLAVTPEHGQITVRSASYGRTEGECRGAKVLADAAYKTVIEKIKANL